MHMPEIIAKKRDGAELSREEIEFVIDGYTRGEIPDYQVSALLMAIVWRGMSRRETSDLTMAMVRSGELLELKVCADGFLYNMVRAITGTVLYAAEGKFLPEDIPAILESRDRTLAGPTVPPGGLYLTRLWYEDERLNG